MTNRRFPNGVHAAYAPLPLTSLVVSSPPAPPEPARQGPSHSFGIPPRCRYDRTDFGFVVSCSFLRPQAAALQVVGCLVFGAGLVALAAAALEAGRVDLGAVLGALAAASALSANVAALARQLFGSIAFVRQGDALYVRSGFGPFAEVRSRAWSGIRGVREEVQSEASAAWSSASGIVFEGATTDVLRPTLTLEPRYTARRDPGHRTPRGGPARRPDPARGNHPRAYRERPHGSPRTRPARRPTSDSVRRARACEHPSPRTRSTRRLASLRVLPRRPEAVRRADRAAARMPSRDRRSLEPRDRRRAAPCLSAKVEAEGQAGTPWSRRRTPIARSRYRCSSSWLPSPPRRDAAR